MFGKILYLLMSAILVLSFPAEKEELPPDDAASEEQELVKEDDFFDKFFDDGYLDDEDFYEKHGITKDEYFGDEYWDEDEAFYDKYFDEDYFKDVPYESVTSLPDVMGYGDRVEDELKLRRELLTEEEKQLYDEFLPYVLSFTPFTIDYRDMDFELDAISNAMHALKLDYPEMWLYFSFGSNLDPTLRNDEGYYGRFVSFGTTYFYLEWSKEGIAAFDAKAIEDYIEKVNDKCNEILSEMPKVLSVEEKYLWIAERVCEMTEYSMDNRYIYADGPLLYGKGLCQSYSFAYQWLCQNAGLWCMTCSGMTPGGSHCWNVVKLSDGKTYYMDLTWADGVTEPEIYYFMTYEECAKDHTPSAGEWIADGDVDWDIDW